MLPNIDGPKVGRRLLLAGGMASILLYAAPVWSSTLCGNMSLRRQMSGPYRLSAIRVVSGYRTVSYNAALVLTAMITLDILAIDSQIHSSSCTVTQFIHGWWCHPPDAMWEVGEWHYCLLLLLLTECQYQCQCQSLPHCPLPKLMWSAVNMRQRQRQSSFWMGYTVHGTYKIRGNAWLLRQGSGNGTGSGTYNQRLPFTPAIVKISHKRKLHQKDIVISMRQAAAGAAAKRELMDLETQEHQL
ncbi:GL18420 [Drosophila persimilis]|uniref:GL18420 n=1 Tax=Drosophila persimilis TaxID=7234 RepID=B4HA57_DROPE|nr:GL18420 [Drosophila persimilis]